MRAIAKVETGISKNLNTEDTQIGASHERLSPRFNAAPTHSRPSGIDALPSARTAGSTRAGI